MKMSMNRFAVLMMSVSVAGLALALSANASPFTYNLSFNGDGSSATGVITIDNGFATSGYLDVTAGPALGSYGLYTWIGGGTSSIRVNGGTDLIVDNLVDANSDPSLDIYGLAFVSSGYTGGYPSEGIDLSLLSGTTYNLAGFGIDGYGVPNANGSVTLTQVPEPSTLAMGGLALLGLARIRHRKT